MNLFRITFTNKVQEFDFFYILDDGYIGDHKLRKLIIENQYGITFNTELWNEYKENNPDYMYNYEVVEIEKIEDVVYNPKLKPL